jgi:formylglycine-generating enzyme required for sulfatase activity/serine/threonine protein kinase
MPDAVIHPTPQELTAFGLGKLPERDAAAVAAHLESCAACRQAVAGVTADSFLDKIRDAKQNATALPSSLANPPNAPSSAGQPPIPIVPCPNVPPELANHPKYRISRELGRGGMGVVYQGWHKEMNRQIVIKVINRALLDKPEALDRFRREIQAAAQLSHPNIVTAHDAEQVGELHILVMEFVPGQNLAEVLEKKGPLSVAHACHYMRQAAYGLQHAHGRGMVHRDIKPQNLIRTPNGRIKILDFGLAKMVRERETDKGLTPSDACMGTAEFMAPEQALDARTADIRADLYSLGCTLYCLLAGRPPFREDTWVKTILAHRDNVPQPLTELRPDVPERLWRVVARLLAKDPAQRYQKPIEVVAALAPFVKPGATPAPKSVAAPPPVVSSPIKGTTIAADTNQIKKILGEVPGKTPPKAVPAKEEAPPLADLTEAAATPKPYRAAWWKRPGVVATAISVSLALILMAVIIIKLRTPDGTIILKDVPENAVVTVDGKSATIKSVDGKTMEISIAAGKKHLLEVKVGGRRMFVPELQIDAGERQTIHVTLNPPEAARNNSPPPPAPRPVPDDKGWKETEPAKGKNKDKTPLLTDEEKWIREVQALPAEQQIEKVKARLKELNPDFDDAVTPTIDANGVVTSLQFVTDHVTDISPVRALTALRVLRCSSTDRGKGQLADLSPLKGMKLTVLDCHYARVSDLSPLKNMKLTSLECGGWLVSDLSPLKNMKLTRLNCWGAPVSDLSPLKDMPLTLLNCGATRVSDLSPLKGMPLTWLMCNQIPVSDLSPLREMPLTWLMCNQTPVSDLSPLKGMALAELYCQDTHVTNLSPLKDMPLKKLRCDFRPERDAEILRSIKTLEEINGKPVAEFWKEVGEAEPKKAPPMKTLSSDPVAEPNKEPSDYRNSLGMKFGLIPAGKFIMGSTPSEIERCINSKSSWPPQEQFESEGPAHKVEITKPFYIGIHEVTVGQFRQFVKAMDYKTQAEKGGGAIRHDPDVEWPRVRIDGDTNWRNPGFKQTDDHPVVCVSWNDADAFCKWLSGKEGRIYRLPSEAEWEYCCRAKTTTRFCCGDDETRLKKFANLADASFTQKWPRFHMPGVVAWSDYYPFTAPVGHFQPNDFGLHDMHGNVWEWCADWYDKNYYKNSPPQDPPGPSGPNAGGERVVRGGSWINAPTFCRSTFRQISGDGAGYNVGFRVVLLPEKRAAKADAQPPKKAEPKKASLSDRIPAGTVLTGTYLNIMPGGDSGTATLTITKRDGNKVKGRYDAKAAGAAQAWPGWPFEGKVVGNKLIVKSVGNAAERSLTLSLQGDALEGTLLLLENGGGTKRVAFPFDK